MSCTHKFFGHPAHLAGEQGLLPSWKAQTLMIGTFKPESRWQPTDTAQYYYGKTRNYFWKILPNFTGKPAIPHYDVAAQIEFLKEHHIGVTDLLIRINDAYITIPEHRRRITTILDHEIERFSEFDWNTPYIQQYLKDNEVKAVYFTKLGYAAQLNVKPNTFEAQIRAIEQTCNELNIPNFRLHNPAGIALGQGSPKTHHLIQRWYQHNGADQFPFLSEDFSLANFQIKL